MPPRNITDPKMYSRGEEIANRVTHGVGAVLAVGGAAVLVTIAALAGDAWRIVGSSVFGATLILLYAASTVYHSVRPRRIKAVLRALDHSAIFLLIAGTYTPLMLTNLRGPWGWSILGVVWGLAVVGIAARLTIVRGWGVVRVTLYVAMGWTIVVAAKPMLEAMARGGLILLLAGGLVYTAGVGLYAWRKLPYHHAIWHGFVLVGSALHYFAILFYAKPLVGAE